MCVYREIAQVVPRTGNLGRHYMIAGPAYAHVKDKAALLVAVGEAGFIEFGTALEVAQRRCRFCGANGRHERRLFPFRP
jgi:hypothetical protein